MIHCREEEDEAQPSMDPSLQTADVSVQTSQTTLNVYAPIFVPSSTLTMASAPGDIQGLEPMPSASKRQGLELEIKYFKSKTIVSNKISITVPCSICSIASSTPTVPSHQTASPRTSLDRVVDLPICLPSKLTFNYYHEVSTTVYQLIEVYAFLAELDRDRPDYVPLKLKIKMPKLNNYTSYNFEPISKEDLNLTFRFVYYIVKQSPPRPALALPPPMPGFGSGSAPSAPPTTQQSASSGVAVTSGPSTSAVPTTQQSAASASGVGARPKTYSAPRQQALEENRAASVSSRVAEAARQGK